jgi:hypothetical protein
VWFGRPSAELPINDEDVRTIMWLLADIRAELVAIHRLLEDEEDGEEAL